jgi:hypothetical protein
VPRRLGLTVRDNACERSSEPATFVPLTGQKRYLSKRVAWAQGPALEDRPLQCPNCSQKMTLQRLKSEAEETATVFECKPCKLSISEAIKDDPDDRMLQ